MFTILLVLELPSIVVTGSSDIHIRSSRVAVEYKVKVKTDAIYWISKTIDRVYFLARDEKEVSFKIERLSKSINNEIRRTEVEQHRSTLHYIHRKKKRFFIFILFLFLFLVFMQTDLVSTIFLFI